MRNIVPLPQGAFWKKGLVLNRFDVPFGDLRNVLHALRHAAEWRDVLAFDEFAIRTIAKRSVPWGDRTGQQWSDDDDIRACAWLQQVGVPANVGVVGRAIQTIARENPVHPVREYLSALDWDRTPRLDRWLMRYLGADDSPYVRAIGSRFLISAVARVFKPGCQADQMLILEGPQGILKSSVLRVLAEPWFSDRLSQLGSKDAAMELAGVWLVEMSELDALTKASNSSIKSFVSRRSDRFRPPYGKHVIDHPRQCVFAGTINPVEGYLKDPTGARRFWPVACGDIDLESLARDRHQLWAEAVAHFVAGTPWWLETPELQTLAKVEQEVRYGVDPWREKVVQWLAGRNDTSVREVLNGALGISKESSSRTVRSRVATSLVSSGFVRYRLTRPGQRRTSRYRRASIDRSDRRANDFKKKCDSETMTSMTVTISFNENMVPHSLQRRRTHRRQPD
jgi:predicted P-loop ATPase